MSRISIIMGIYNCADTLAEAIDSIIAQTYTDWELIMCDDASTDDGRTLALAKHYETLHENIHVIQNEKNLGLAATLNHCLEYAHSEFIARMDGDDLSLPTRFEEQVAFLDEHPEYALVSGQMINFDENGEWGVQGNVECPTKLDFVYRSPFCHAPVMMRREALNSVGNYTVRPDLRRGQDYYLWHKFYVAGYKGYNFQHPIYKMRDDQNASKRRNFKNRLYSAKKHIEVMRNLGLPKRYYLVSLRPIIISLCPNFVYNYFHRRRANNGKSQIQK